MLIKRHISCLLVFVLAFIICSLQNYGTAYANAGPPVIMPVGGAGGIIFENNQSIRIDSEQLNFVIKDSDYGDYTAEVSATYNMQNTHDNVQNVQMLFPFYTSLYGRVNFLDALSSISVTAGDEDIPYTIRVLEGAHYEYERDTNKFIEKVNTILEGLQEQRELNIDVEAEYDVYYFKTKEGANTVTLEFTDDNDGFIFLGGSENSFSRHADRIITELWQSHLDDHPIFAVCNADSGGFAIAEGNGNIERIERIDDIKAFFIDYITTIIDMGEHNDEDSQQEGFLEANPLFLEDIFNIALSRDYNPQGSSLSPAIFREVLEFAVLGIYYQVDFDAGGSKDLTVSYNFSPYMLHENGVYTHTYIYFLSPAGHWKEFKNLNVSVDVSSTRYKYLLDSSVQFEYDEDAEIYRYISSSLPNGELVFKLFHEKELPANPYNALLIIIGAIACVLLAAVVFWLVIRHRRK